MEVREVASYGAPQEWRELVYPTAYAGNRLLSNNGDIRRRGDINIYPTSIQKSGSKYWQVKINEKSQTIIVEIALKHTFKVISFDWRNLIYHGGKVISSLELNKDGRLRRALDNFEYTLQQDGGYPTDSFLGYQIRNAEAMAWTWPSPDEQWVQAFYWGDALAQVEVEVAALKFRNKGTRREYTVTYGDGYPSIEYAGTPLYVHVIITSTFISNQDFV